MHERQDLVEQILNLHVQVELLHLRLLEVQLGDPREELQELYIAQLVVLLQRVLIELVDDVYLRHAKRLVDHLVGQFEREVIAEKCVTVLEDHPVRVVRF